MVAFKILAGGYDVFVATYLFNSTSSSLSLTSKSYTGQSPSWLSLHPTNSSVVYAVNEVYSGALQSFIISNDGALSNAFSTIPSGGNSPAFAAALSTGEVAVFNYGSGNGKIVPMAAGNPQTLDASAPLISLPQPAAPAVSHPHEAVEYNGELFVPDLGGDKIWRLKRQSAGHYNIQGQINQPAGSGPRHMAFNNNRLFTLHELTSTLTVQKIPTAPNGTDAGIIASASIIPPNPPSGAAFAGGEIFIPPATPAFPNQYIYVSNRNTGNQDPRGDSIAIFEHVNKDTPQEGLQLINQVYTGIDQPRGMTLGPAHDGGDQYVAVGGVAGNGGVIIFQRTNGGRNLTVVAKNTDVPTRTSFVWL
jgi:6-phosphogluconolactonase (cycloisomerase 2 family)